MRPPGALSPAEPAPAPPARLDAADAPSRSAHRASLATGPLARRAGRASTRAGSRYSCQRVLGVLADAGYDMPHGVGREAVERHTDGLERLMRAFAIVLGRHGEDGGRVGVGPVRDPPQGLFQPLFALGWLLIDAANAAAAHHSGPGISRCISSASAQYGQPK